jgi:autotransporter-associated beta strand protein
VTTSSIATTEWKGTTDAIWGSLNNWLGATSVPTSSSDDISVTFRDLDPGISTKVINVNSTYSITRLNVGAFSPKVTLGGTGTLILGQKKGLSSRIVHTGSSLFTVGTNVQITGPVELSTQVPSGTAYMRWNNPVSGTGSFNKTGAGTLLLMNTANSYSGGFNWNEASLIQLGGATAAANTTSQQYFGTGTLTIGTADESKKFILETYNAELASGDATKANTERYVSSNLVLRGNLTIQRQTNLGALLTNTSDIQSGVHFTGTTRFGASGDAVKNYTLTTYSANGFIHTSATQLYFDGDVSGNANITQTGLGQIYFNGDNSAYTGNYTFKEGDVIFAKSNPFGKDGTLTLDATCFQVLYSLGPNGLSVPNRIDFSSVKGVGFRGIINFDHDSSNGGGNSKFLNGEDYEFGAEASTPTIVTFGKNHVIEGSAKLVFGIQSSFDFRGTARFLGANVFTGQIDAYQGPIQTGRDSAGSSGGLGTGMIRFMSPSTMIGAYVGPDSANPGAKSITMANPISFTNSAGVTIFNTGVGVDAPTLIWSTPSIALRNGKSDFVLNIDNVNETDQKQVLRIQSKLINNTAGNPGGITKIGTGTLELTNAENAIGDGIQVQGGVVRTEFSGSSKDLTLGTGSADAAFGTGSRLAQSANRVGTAGSFEIKALTSGATLTLQAPGLARYTLNDNGQLRITGTNVTTVLASNGSLLSTELNPARVGALVADNVRASNFTLGVQMKTPLLTIAGSTGDGFLLLRDNLLTGTGNLALGANGKLSLNYTTQEIPSLTINGNSAIDMSWSGFFDSTDPLTLTLDSITINSGLLTFQNWSGDADTGFGETRIIVNTTAPGSNLALGTLLTGIQFGANTDTNQAIVKRADDGIYVLVPFDSGFVWDGTTSNIWAVKNWTRTSTHVHSDITAPGTSANSPSIAVFDTTMHKDGSAEESITNGGTITLTGDVYLMNLRFQGNAVKNYTLSGGHLMLDSGAFGPGTSTMIKNTGAGNVTINSPVTLVFDIDNIASRSTTLGIRQEGTGNLTFMQQISGPMAGISITSTAGSGYVAFKGNNSFSREFILNSGRVLVGTDSALGNGAVVRWRAGTLESVDNIAGSTAAQSHNLSFNNYELDASNGILTLDGEGSLAFGGHGGVRGNNTLNVANAAATFTLGTSLRNLDAPASGGTLTLTGPGKVDINASNVGQVGQVRVTSPLGENITTGALTINVNNTQTKFTSATVDATINVGANAKAVYASTNGTYGGLLTVSENGDVDISNEGNVLSGGIANAGTIHVEANTTFGGNATTGATLTGIGIVDVDIAKTLTLKTSSASAANATFAGAITGEGALKKENAGTQILSGTSSYTGRTDVNGGELKITGKLGGTSATYAAPITVGSGAKLTFAQTANQTLSGVVNGAGTIEKSGTGILTVSNAVSVSSLTVKTASTLAVTSTGTVAKGIFEAGSTLTGSGKVADATFQYGVTYGSGVTLSPGGDAAQDVLHFGSASVTTTTFAGITLNLNLTGSTGSDRLDVTGAGIWGALNTINILDTWRTGTFTLLTTSTGLTASDLSNTKIYVGGSEIFINNPMANPLMIAELKIIGNNLVLQTYSAPNMNLVWDGASTMDTWNLVNSNWEDTETPPNTGLVYKDGDFVIFDDTASAKTVKVLLDGTRVAGMKVSGSNYHFTGGKTVGDEVTPPLGNLVSPNGKLELTSSATNIRFDNTLDFVEIDIAGDAIFAGSVTSFDSLKVSGQVVLDDGGSLNIRNGAPNALNVELQTPGSSLEFKRSVGNDYTYSGVVSGSGSLAKSGRGQVTLTANQTYTGATSVSGGTLTLKGTLTGGTYTADITFSNDGTLELNQTDDQVLSGTLSGNGNLVKSGTGKLTLTGANDYKDTTVTKGTLAISSDNNLGTGTNTLNGGTLSLGANTYTKTWTLGGNGGTIEASGTVTQNGALSGTGGLTKTGAGQLVLGGNNTYTGNTTLSGGSFRLIGLLGGGDYAGNIITNVGGESLIFEQSGDQIVRGAISGVASLSKSQANTLTFAGDNTYTGNTLVSAGRLVVTGRLGAGNYAGTIQVNNGATIEFNQSVNQALTGGFTGAGHFVKRGTGTLTLTAATNSAFNTVLVDGGGFRVNGALQATSVNVTAGTLGGAGTITTASALTVATGAGLAPGAGGAGTLTVIGGNVELASGAKFYVGISGNDESAYDHLVVVNNEVHLGGVDLDLSVFLSSTFEPDPAMVYTIIQAGKIEGQFSSGNRAWAPATAWAFDIVYNTDSVQLTNARPVVPEPSTYALFAAAGALALAAVRRRKKVTGMKNEK